MNSNTENIWIENGYKDGDILVFLDNTLNDELIVYQIFPTKLVVANTVRYADFLSDNRSDIGWDSMRMVDHFKFKVQDYIDNVSSPTDTEISLLKLQFPEVDIDKVINCIKQRNSYNGS